MQRNRSLSPAMAEITRLLPFHFSLEQTLSDKVSHRRV